jgi:hypothetical protein
MFKKISEERGAPLYPVVSDEVTSGRTRLAGKGPRRITDGGENV